MALAYVPGFENDIFISYAHADNTEGWVDRFHEHLLNRLRQLERNAPFTIWRDPKLGGADIFSDEIYKNLNSSAVLISILSPNGLDSNWCQQERQRFEQAAASSGGFRIADKIRAIKIVKTPLPDARHQQIFGTLGYDFFEVQQSGRFREFHPSSPEFDAQVLELAQELFDLLKRLRARSQSPAADLNVYVAAVTSDLEQWRRRVSDQLAAWNCRVLPEIDSFSSLTSAVIEEALSRCVFSVHCVGSKRGFIPESEEYPIDALQLERARAKGLNRIVCQIGPPHAALEDALKKAPQAMEELLDSATLDQLLQLLEDRVKSFRAAPPGSIGVLPTVYIVCDPSEWDAALRLKACLEADRRYAAVLPLRDVDDESVRLRDHRQSLKFCQAVLVYWGQSARESWFREQQREVIGARQKRRKTPLPALCVSSSPHTDRAVYNRPDLPLEEVPDIRCDEVRPLFRYLNPAGGDNK